MTDKPRHISEPAVEVLPAITRVEEPVNPDRVFDPRKKVKVYDKNTGEVHPGTVPESWLDGRFPNLVQTPSSKKAGK